MAYSAPQVLGTWDVGGRPASVNSATAVTAGLIPPFMGGPGRARRVWDYRTPDGRNNTLVNSGITHVEKAVFLNGATNIMQFTLMRPINFTWAVANNTVVSSHTRILLPNDPAAFQAWGTTVGPTVGMASTASTYLYDNNLVGGVCVPGTAAKWPPSAGVATNAMAAGDFVAVQVADGTWILDTVLSGYSSQFTTGLPTTGTSGYVDLTGNFPAGSILAGAPFYYFGPCTSSTLAISGQYLDPATGTLPPIWGIAISSSMTLTGQNPYSTAGGYGICSTLHVGDPMMFALSCNNTPTILLLETLCGWYSKGY